MTLLKGLALSLLSLLLFLSLSIFGLVLTLNHTILNPDFVISELNRLDMSSLAEDFLSEQTSEDFPEGLRDALTDAMPKIEPRLEEQINTLISTIYDYLRGKNQNLDLTLTLGDTVLNPDFIVSLLDEIDLSSLTNEFISQQIPKERFPEEFSEILNTILDRAIVKLEPWIKEQVRTIIYPIPDYLLGKSQSLNVVISLEPVRDSLKSSLRNTILELAPPEITGIPQATIEQYINEAYRQIDELVPANFVFTESALDPEIREGLRQAIIEVEGVLKEAKQYVGYFLTGYNVLIALILLLILSIVWLNRQVRGATRELGIIFLTCGALELIGVFTIKNLAGTQLPLLDVPPSIQAWLPQLLDAFLTPLQLFSIGLLVVGIALVTVSFVYKPRQPSLT